MHYKISNIKIPIEQYDGEVLPFIVKHLKLDVNRIINIKIISQSVDARRRRNNDIYFIFTLLLDYPVQIQKHKQIQVTMIDKREELYIYKSNTMPVKMDLQPIVVGFGPSGIFAALRLAENGLRPIILERGKNIEGRKKDVDNYWENGILDISSNVQFGEGGAGTFSDGKLTTRVKDPKSKEILRYFIEEGAPDEIETLRKPHIGTDKLRNIITNLRHRIEKLGGKIIFNSCVTDVIIEEGHARGVMVNHHHMLRSDHIVLAIGHSARDTHKNIIEKKIAVEAKGLAIGLRVEHKQDMINASQYGTYKDNPFLKAAEYQLAFQDPQTGRGVYSFCMCPGGLVIASSSEENSVVTNGMSYHARNCENANSAIVSTIYPKDFNYDPIKGMELQRKYEQIAFDIGGKNHHAPIQLLGDFINERTSTSLGSITPTYKPGWTFSDLRNCLPDEVGQAIKNALYDFDLKIHGFLREDAVLTGVESRTSSPLRIIRGAEYQSINTQGIYPVGEGAGYAGGIMSAAIDGLKCAHAILKSIL